MKKSLLVLSIVLTALIACRKPDNEANNLMTYAKVYGYVKYFHPSDEAVSIDWAKFSAFGAKEIEKCRTKSQMINTLNRLFNPIAPSVKFTISQNKPDYDLNIITPANPSEYRLTYWQHKGVSIGMRKTNYAPYTSVRANRENTTEDNKLFDYQPDLKYIITKEIGNGIYCQVPVVLYCNNKNTYPKSDSTLYMNLMDKLNLFDYSNEQPALRLGNVINIYNVFQHFYPYFDVIKINWVEEFSKAILRSFNDKTLKDHLITLQKFTAPLRDGHLNVYGGSSEYFAPPIAWEWAENKLVISKYFENKPDIHIGDIVTKIDGIEPEKYFENIYSLTSAPTKGWLDHRANVSSLMGEEGSKLTLTINGKSIDIIRDKNMTVYYSFYRDKEIRYKVIGDSIWYLNMDRIEMDTINKLLPRLVKCRAIICDARGYPNGNHDLIKHLMKTDDTTSAWMQVPEIVYPDQENIVGFEKHNWISMMKASRPYLGDKKIIYIINGSAISYAESCLGYIEGYKLATIVGQPSAGTNGNVNSFTLPGGFNISFTGMKVVRHDGSQQHGIGILPDIYITKTIKGIQEGRDEFLEKAIELANK